MCSRCIAQENSIPEASVADLLSFEAWPEELKRIARAALGDQMAMLRADEQERVIAVAQGEQADADEVRYGRVYDTVTHISIRIGALAKNLREYGVDERWAKIADEIKAEADKVPEVLADA